ncbi:inosine-adenosine-guanosine-nucleosidehydrolase, putative [Leishmania tarentolae]|uniref:Inosine-adenosine-guanosine-nucleosidehydrolase, putative n=1 Tax=Leishmania tarentolae TaxID=5689 RepID=A0A640KSQ9_LEITA|nr:inosine-adenosine-guanosine-nucleosidehydrolase, putative [Leishmania tarentolae]
MPPKPVIIDHDGGHDDLVALAVLLGNPEAVRVIGCIVTDADCFVDQAFNVSGKLMAMVHASGGTDLFPVAKTSFKGVNPFPSEWRWSAKNMDDLPCANVPEHLAIWNAVRDQNDALVGEEVMAQLVMSSPEKVTICVTGPLSCVAWCIERYGEEFCKNVEECIIMGGAVDVTGNVFIDNRTDGTAEWNIFWDPTAAKTVFTCPHLKKIIFSLDSTNSVPVTSEVVQKFGAQNKYLLSQFVGSAWASCTHFELMRPGDSYYAWDVLTAAYAIDRRLADVEAVSLEVVMDANAPNEGQTRRAADGAPFSNTYIAKNTKADMFYQMVMNSVRCCCP